MHFGVESELIGEAGGLWHVATLRYHLLLAKKLSHLGLGERIRLTDLTEDKESACFLLAIFLNSSFLILYLYLKFLVFCRLFVWLKGACNEDILLKRQISD